MDAFHLCVAASHAVPVEPGACWSHMIYSCACIYQEAGQPAYPLSENDPLDTPTATGQHPAAAPEGMFRELLWVHAHLRQDLQTVRRLADAAHDGLSPETILAEIRDLQTNSPLWRLKFGCIRYCRFVNLHHQVEDTALFPTIRSQDQSLGTALDRLQADHRAVHAITDRIAAIADRVPGDAS